MDKTRQFITGNFIRNYLLIFLPFFLIVSLVFIVRISVLSSKISLSGWELVELYSFFLPEIIFFTIPLSFIASIVNTFTKLSEDNELTAIFALGFRPHKILMFLLPSATLFSAILVVVSIMIYPHMKQKLAQFKQQKLAEATLNIEPKKLSQSFGNFHIYVDEKIGNRYKGVVLFNNKDSKSYQLLIADIGKVENQNGKFALKLYNGIGESSTPNKIEELKYDRLNIYQYSQHGSKRLKSISEYWSGGKKRRSKRGKLLYLLFVSISPLLVFSIAVSISIYNPRYQKNLGFVIIFILALLVYIPAAILQKSGNIYLFIAFIILFLALNIYVIKYKLLGRY